MSQLTLKVVTPEEEIFNDQVEMVTVETSQGELGILPHHANLMAQIVPGHLRIKKGSKIISLATGGGLLQMANNTLSIITDTALEASDIDEKAAEEARKRAQDALSRRETALSDEEYADTLAILERSLAQLKVKRRHRAV